jgi:hypothetical protein
MTRRCEVCWSEPRSVPRPAYNDGGCASLSLKASQDWHKAMESMPDEENARERVNPGPKRTNLAWGEVIRPGPGESQPGPAGTVRRGSPAAMGVPACLGMPAWANSGLGSDPDPLEWRPSGGAVCRSRPGHAGTAGVERRPARDWPASPAGKRSTGPAEGEERRPSGGRTTGPAGKKGDPGPARERDSSLAREEVCQPSRDGNVPAQPGRAIMPAQAALCRPEWCLIRLGYAHAGPASSMPTQLAI